VRLIQFLMIFRRTKKKKNQKEYCVIIY